MLAEVMPVAIPLADRNGLVLDYTLVSLDDFERVGRLRWYKGNHGYAVRKPWNGGRPFQELLHRVVCGLGRGDERQVDHLNRNRLDNRRCNLEVVTREENFRRARETQNAEASYVHHWKRRDRWQAYFVRGSRRIHLGNFGTREEAVAAVERARKGDPDQLELRIRDAY